MDSERAQLQSMRAIARGPSPAPWIAAAILTALAFAVGRFTRGEGRRPHRPRSLAPVAAAADPRPANLDALRGCVAELGALQTRVDQTCPALTRPGAAVDGGATLAAEASTEAVHRVEFRKRLVEQVVGVGGTAGEWLADYVCLADAMHDRTMREIEAAMRNPDLEPGAVDEIIAEARQELDTIHGDIEARLGPQRYARLREAGGLSVLALGCAARPTEAAEQADAGSPDPR